MREQAQTTAQSTGSSIFLIFLWGRRSSRPLFIPLQQFPRASRPESSRELAECQPSGSPTRGSTRHPHTIGKAPFRGGVQLISRVVELPSRHQDQITLWIMMFQEREKRKRSPSISQCIFCFHEYSCPSSRSIESFSTRPTNGRGKSLLPYDQRSSLPGCSPLEKKKKAPVGRR